MSTDVSSNAVPLPTWQQSRARLRYLATFIGPHKRTFAASIVSMIVSTLTGMSLPYLFKHAIDRGILQGDTGAITMWIVLALVLALFTLVITIANTYWSLWSYRALNDVQVALFAHIQRQGLAFFHRMRTGVVISRLTNDVDAVSSLVNDGVFMVFLNILSLGVIEGFLIVMDWRLAMAVNVIFPVMIAASAVFRYYSTRSYRRTRERMALVTAFLAESLSGMRVIQAFSAEQRMAARFERTADEYRTTNMETIHQSAIYYPLVEVLSAAGTALVLWYGGVLEARDLVTVGVLFAFIAYLNDFFDPIQQLSQFYSSFLSGMAALDKIMGVMEMEPEIVDHPDARVIEDLRGDVHFDHVTFAYDADRVVLHDITLDVRAGETIALVGQTGAGKSTFVRLISRFYDPQHGTITLDGVDLRDLKQQWLRTSLGIVPQEGFLFAGSVADNIRFGRPGASDEDVRAAAASVGADAFVQELADGYDTHVGERGTHLSAGQRQLIAFARAMLANPRLLVLDEATSSVDVATEQRLADGLRSLVAGRTSFIVAHRLTTIRGADRIVVIEDGRIAEHGTHDDLIAAGGTYAQLYGSWSGHSASIESRLDEALSSAEDAPVTSS